jgi:hypothetical protein
MKTAMQWVACAIGALASMVWAPMASAIDIDENGTARMRVDGEDGVTSPSGFGDGWEEDAYLDLQGALADADDVLGIQGVVRVEIWVRAIDGTYVPGDDDGDTFGLINDVQILGGFFGDGSSRGSTRTPASTRTTGKTTTGS